MKERRQGLVVKFPILVLLVAAVPATASAFCFSFGSKSNDHARYGSYPPPYPGLMAPSYSGYGYSPVPPAYTYDGYYFPSPPPYATLPPEFIRR